MRNRINVLTRVYSKEVATAFTVGFVASVFYGYAVSRGVSMSNITDMHFVERLRNGDYVFNVLQGNGRSSIVTVDSREIHGV